MPKSWNGIQTLARPVSLTITKGPWVDIFYRRRLKLWLVWSFVPPVKKDNMHRQIILLGGFHDRARARFAADTALVALRRDSGMMAMMQDLLAEGNFLDVLHGVSHVADVAPFRCPHRVRTNVFSRLGPQDIERLTQQIEQHNVNVQDWRFMWIGKPGEPVSPTLIRVRDQQPAAFIALEHDTFAGQSVRFWLDNAEHTLTCKPVDLSENPLSFAVLDNLAHVMQYCDKLLKDQYGADSNAKELIALLREEGTREATRQMAQAFGTAHHVGEA